MKKIIVIFCILISYGVKAQEGIHFEHGSWGEVKAQAIKEKKLIFTDFYTQWCGPCLAMAEDVFSLESVGNFYNQNFICYKIDAENGEGIALAKQYKVNSYPTFIFIDPATEKIVHLSTSRQDKETFLYTGKSALDPMKTSVYFEEQLKQGNSKPMFLLDYAMYSASRYNREEVEKLIVKLSSIPEFSLENEKVWKFFDKSVNGRDNAYFEQMLKNYTKLTQLYGIQALEDKLFKEFNYCPDEAEFAAAPNFKGKDFLMMKNKADRLIKEEKYEEGAAIIEQLMANPGELNDELCNYLYYTGRSALYGEHSDFWKKCCLIYIRYVAYNQSNRDNAMIHFEYASMLEKMVLSSPDVAKIIPAEFTQKPKYGKSDYSMRSPKLKPKPKH